MATGSQSWALVRAAAAVRSTDPARVQAAFERLGGKRRWLAPLAYAAGTVGVVFEGILLLLRSWRLALLQLAPAAWIWVMTWNLKSHFLSNRHIPIGTGPLAAIAVILAAQLAYWCNATFAYTLAQDAASGVAAAFRRARGHWRLVGGLALLTGAAPRPESGSSGHICA